MTNHLQCGKIIAELRKTKEMEEIQNEDNDISICE